ncbi:NAD(P)H-dependent oxidoreductase [Bacillus sp. FJAT-50079]|uniref:NADPH-dependent FMN reductase n=1 Tax=Bacillus sp. FJAT-50079 TaxID=2833577 RepID=UPI001BCA3363|nr:NAD(P)H-dependent oxidoreductase [Bacillus sp. FJAT-50079]MBS4206621.1 NAD(P)H-dependent oxidoreductase [Bacillus sp. FJAT-50079]
MKIIGVSGSAATSRRTRALINEVLRSVRGHGIETEVIDLADTQLEFCDGRPFDHYNSSTKDVLEKIRDADAYIFGSPMYRGTMTGALKNLIDLLPTEFMKGKAAGLIATGGSDHHYLGLELGFRTALSFFQVHTIPGILYCSKVEVINGEIADEHIKKKAYELGEDIVNLAKSTRGKALGPSLY